METQAQEQTPQLTITEALAEVSLVQKKIVKKRTTVNGTLTVYEHQDDPYQKDGGIEKAIAAEVQSINDLEKRLLNIRTGIAKANMETKITIGKTTRTIFDWLTWRREVAEKHKEFSQGIYSQTKRAIDQNAQRPAVFKDTNDEQQLAKVKAVLPYTDYLKDAEDVEDTLEKLDGLLSLKNATTTITLN